MKIISLSAYHLILWAFLDNLIEVLEEAREVLEQVDKEAQTLSSAGSYKHPRTGTKLSATRIISSCSTSKHRLAKQELVPRRVAAEESL